MKKRNGGGREREAQRERETKKKRCVSPDAGDGEKHVNWIVEGKLEL